MVLFQQVAASVVRADRVSKGGVLSCCGERADAALVPAGCPIVRKPGRVDLPPRPPPSCSGEGDWRSSLHLEFEELERGQKLVGCLACDQPDKLWFEVDEVLTCGNPVFAIEAVGAEYDPFTGGELPGGELD